jgi:hypothetical protein
MSRVIPRTGGAARTGHAARSALLLVAFCAAGCTPDDAAYDEIAEQPLDTLVADTGRLITDTGGIVTDTAPAASPVLRDDTARSTIVPSVRPPVLPSRDTVRAVVQGRAELQVDAKTYMAADYLLVRLQSGRITVGEAWTTRTGEYYFENVRPGTYELVFMRSPKEPRPLYRTRVTVQTGGSMSLPVVHIPIDSIKSPTRG